MKETSSIHEARENPKQVEATLGAIADLKHDNKLLRAENANLREANTANSQMIDDLAVMIDLLAPHWPP